MLINLSSVLSDRHKLLDETVELGMNGFETKAGIFPVIRKSPVHLTVEHVKGKELLIRAQTEVVISIPCDRCLKDVPEKFQLEVTRHVDLDVSDAEVSEELDEADFIDGYELDVDRLIYNEILVEWPSKVLCREECKGICSVCGQNLNEGTCDCESTGLDPRMSVVRDLFKNFKEV